MQHPLLRSAIQICPPPNSKKPAATLKRLSLPNIKPHIFIKSGYLGGNWGLFRGGGVTFGGSIFWRRMNFHCLQLSQILILYQNSFGCLLVFPKLQIFLPKMIISSKKKIHPNSFCFVLNGTPWPLGGFMLGWGLIFGGLINSPYLCWFGDFNSIHDQR